MIGDRLALIGNGKFSCALPGPTSQQNSCTSGLVVREFYEGVIVTSKKCAQSNILTNAQSCYFIAATLDAGTLEGMTDSGLGLLPFLTSQILQMS